MLCVFPPPAPPPPRALLPRSSPAYTPPALVSASHHLIPSLTTAYARAGALDAAKATLAASAPSSSIAAWNAPLVAQSRRSASVEALRVFRALPSAARPDSTTFTLALSACAPRGSRRRGGHQRLLVRCRVWGKYVFVCSALVRLYSRYLGCLHNPNT
jgi:hypothetical protein